MKNVKRIFVIIFMLAFILSISSINAFAATVTQDNLEVTLVTDKEKYSENEQIKTTLTVKNNNDTAVTNVDLETALPDGYKLADKSENKKTVDSIAAGESVSLDVTLEKDNTKEESIPSEPSTDPKSSTNPVSGGNSGGSGTTTDGTTTNGSAIQTGQNILVIGITIFIALMSGFVFVYAYRKKRSLKNIGKNILSLVLCISLVGGTFMFSYSKVNAEEISKSKISIETGVVVNNNKTIIKSNISYNAINKSEYTVSFDLNYEGAPSIEKKVVKANTNLTEPTVPDRDGYVFVGWYIDKNEDDWDNKFSFVDNSISNDIVLYAKWADLSIDSDGDGLPDDIEKIYKTGINNPDSDNDELNDYLEIVILNYNPLSSDTDGNGIADGDEDNDQDKISNKDEIKMGTDLTIPDSDGDTLSDYDENTIYHTNPLLEDTDSDGANDGWEVENNFDPLVFNESFSVEISSTGSSNKDVSAHVRINTNGKQASSISINPVNENENPFVSDSIPGYIGDAFDFSAEGDISKATISFTYDVDLNTGADSFVPRIYYLNENSNTLEELENQTVNNNEVSAEVSHFSKYILLNKVEFDKVWTNEIRPPFSDGNNDEATLDIMFVIDYSASMDDNDPKHLFKDLIENFVNKLRDDKDRAGAVKFIRKATLVCGLTTDKNKIINSVKGITYDDGWGTYSGTDGSAGLKMALDELGNSDSKYKYIVFITDGEDNGYSYSYDDLIATAKEQSTVIYTVGMGSASESVLRRVATATSGKYYHATTSISTDDLLNLDEVFDDIESQTVDLKTDSNNDGIPDYYNQLIKKGQLVLSNGSTEFACIDFNYDKNGNPSNDYDGDGIINGKELKVVQSGKYIYLEMASNPIYSDSDGDGYNDSNDNNPLKWDVSDRDLAMFAALAYETPSTYNNRTIDDNYYFLNYGSANEVYDHWNIVDCSGETFADIATHFYATTYKNDNNVIIAYRGTDNEWGEWVNNIVGVGLLNYHSEEGLAKQYADRIVQKYPECHIYITGHSLGGYLSQFGAFEIEKKHPYVDLKKVVYFNGIGLKYNKLLFWTKNDEINTLKNYYNNSQKNPNLISYNIKGDVVSALGSHSGATIGFTATSSAIAQHRGKYGSGSLKEILSKSVAGWLSVLSSENVAYWYDQYDCSSIKEYFWITHETDSFFNYLKAGSR